MKHKVILLFFSLILCNKVVSQTHYISLHGQKVYLANNAYHVSEVIDKRNNKSTIGQVKKGVLNRKVDANFQQSIEKELENFLVNNLSSEGPSLQVVIRYLEISERTDFYTEKGFCKLSLDFLLKSESESHLILQTSQTSEVINIDVTNQHPQNIAHAFKLCFDELAKIDLSNTNDSLMASTNKVKNNEASNSRKLEISIKETKHFKPPPSPPPTYEKQDIGLHVSLPHINFYNFTPENEEVKVRAGFLGLTLGIDYYHSKSQFINLAASGVLDFLLPFPAPVDIFGEYESMSSWHTSLTNNHKIKRFTLGYGICYAKNKWSLNYRAGPNLPPPSRDPVTKKSNTFGLVFASYFQPGRCFNVGIVYRPTFFRPNNSIKFMYEHLISIDFAWKIKLTK